MTAKKLDLSLFSLLAANLITIVLAVLYRWSILELMWIYWFQSVTIGVINYGKIRRTGDKDIAGFFALHYGFFHFMYALFLLIFSLADDSPLLGPTPIYWPSVFGTALMFFFNHLFSYIYNWPKEAAKWTADRLMAFPYARIFPMHLTLILGGLAEVFFPASPTAAINFPILLFLGLKTGADLVMHLIEHK